MAATSDVPMELVGIGNERSRPGRGHAESRRGLLDLEWQSAEAAQGMDEGVPHLPASQGLDLEFRPQDA
jgi:hypothetical protein